MEVWYGRVYSMMDVFTFRIFFFCDREKQSLEGWTSPYVQYVRNIVAAASAACSLYIYIMNVLIDLFVCSLFEENRLKGSE